MEELFSGFRNLKKNIFFECINQLAFSFIRILVVSYERYAVTYELHRNGTYTAAI